jgi:hypothetical protein
VDITVQLPSGDLLRYVVKDQTDQHGITKIDFPFEVQASGEAQVDVRVTHEALKGQTATSFRVWW